MAKNMFDYGVRDFMLFTLASEPDDALPTYSEQLDTNDTNAVNVTRDTASATADGDDKQVANITITTGASLEWTVWGIAQETAAAIYGHEISADGAIIEKMDDMAPYVGVGYVKTITDNMNQVTFKAYFYFKCQAVQGDEESTSAGSDLNLGATTVTLNSVQPAYGGFRQIKECETEDEAVSWIKELAGVSDSGSGNSGNDEP